MSPNTDPPERVVVLLHGFAGMPEAWTAVIDAWPTPQPRWVVPALPGHGMPTQAERGFAGALDAVAATIGPQPTPPHLIGYSLGARLSLGLAVNWPTWWSSVSLIGVNPGLDAAHRSARRTADAGWAARLEDDGLTAFLDAWRAQPIFASQARLSAEVLDNQTAWRRRLDAHELANAMRQMSLADMPDYRVALPRLPMPLQLVVGSLDKKFWALARAMKTLHPAAQLDVIPDAGHNVPLESPQALAATLSRFVAAT